MKLHGYFRSSASFRVRIALNLKGLDPERAYYHLRREEHRTPTYLAMNPQGLVPTLEDDGAFIGQSLAVIEYLEETHPEPPLLPADPVGRARVRSLAQIVACDIHPLNNLRALKYLRGPLAQPEEAVGAWFNHWIAAGFDALEAQLRRGPTGRFCHGDAPGLADCCLVPQVISSRNFQLDLTPYPTIRRIAETCLAMPEFERALPANQPDAD
jgi:maleylpyruvate isomerase